MQSGNIDGPSFFIQVLIKVQDAVCYIPYSKRIENLSEIWLNKVIQLKAAH